MEEVAVPSMSCEELEMMCLQIGGIWCLDYEALCRDEREE